MRWYGNSNSNKIIMMRTASTSTTTTKHSKNQEIWQVGTYKLHSVRFLMVVFRLDKSLYLFLVENTPASPKGTITNNREFWVFVRFCRRETDNRKATLAWLLNVVQGFGRKKFQRHFWNRQVVTNVSLYGSNWSEIFDRKNQQLHLNSWSTVDTALNVTTLPVKKSKIRAFTTESSNSSSNYSTPRCEWKFQIQWRWSESINEWIPLVSCSR